MKIISQMLVRYRNISNIFIYPYRDYTKTIVTTHGSKPCTFYISNTPAFFYLTIVIYVINIIRGVVLYRFGLIEYLEFKLKVKVRC